MAKIIRFDSDKFLNLYKLPARPDTERKARLIYKALEIYDRIKRKATNGNKN